MNSAQTWSRKSVVVVHERWRKSVGVPTVLYCLVDTPKWKIKCHLRCPLGFFRKGGSQTLHKGIMLGVVRDARLRCDGVPSYAPGRRGAHPPPLWQGHQQRDRRTPTPALGERPAVDGAVLHRWTRQRQHRWRYGGESPKNQQKVTQIVTRIILRKLNYKRGRVLRC